MTRITLILATLALGATGVLTAGASIVPQAPEVIEIAVPAGDLAACRATLAEMAQAPLVSDRGGPAFFQPRADLPGTVCVLR